jgi:hypothetical protein
MPPTANAPAIAPSKATALARQLGGSSVPLLALLLPPASREACREGCRQDLPRARLLPAQQVATGVETRQAVALVSRGHGRTARRAMRTRRWRGRDYVLGRASASATTAPRSTPGASAGRVGHLYGNESGGGTPRRGRGEPTVSVAFRIATPRVEAPDSAQKASPRLTFRHTGIKLVAQGLRLPEAGPPALSLGGRRRPLCNI